MHKVSGKQLCKDGSSTHYKQRASRRADMEALSRASTRSKMARCSGGLGMPEYGESGKKPQVRTTTSYSLLSPLLVRFTIRNGASPSKPRAREK